MGVSLIEVAVEEVEALIVGPALVVAAVRAESPFAADGGRIAGLLQELGERDVAVVERGDVGGAVAANAGVAGVQAGHQHAARRCADGRAGVELRESHALRRPGDRGAASRQLAGRSNRGRRSRGRRRESSTMLGGRHRLGASRFDVMPATMRA